MSGATSYNFMENVLHSINRKFISLEEEEKKRNNEILDEVLQIIIGNLKEMDELFKALYERVFYGGSFYDGLKICKPNEYNLHLLFRVPKDMEPSLIFTNEPAFVKMQFQDLTALDRQPTLKKKYQAIVELYNEEGYLDTKKVIPWMYSILTHALNLYPGNGQYYLIQTSNGRMEVILSKKEGSPAFTLKITAQGKRSITMDIDLVPCFIFGKDYWPHWFRKNGTDKEEFFIVPKYPGEVLDKSLYWRPSFQEQERVLIKSKERLKPVIRLLKKLRDTQGHVPMKSYFLKTIGLLEIDARSPFFWNNSLSYVFMTLLQSYSDLLTERNIPFYWNNRHNLIEKWNVSTIDNINNRIKTIIKDIKRTTDPDVIEKYLLTEEERYEGSFVDDRPDFRASTSSEESYDESNSTSTVSGLNVGLAAVGITAAVVSGAILLGQFWSRDRRRND